MSKACWGIFRESTHSPGRESDDSEILRLTGKHLEAKGFHVELKTADEVTETDEGWPRFVFLMCERVEVLDRLRALEASGVPHVNSPRAVHNTYRDRMIALLDEANVPFIPSRVVGLSTTDVGVPVLWWRSVGSTHTAFALETFLDELAEAAGADPLDFRLDLLPPRHATVLKLAADKAGWGTPAPEGRTRGLALAESFNTPVAQVAEVSVADGAARVHKVVCAVDCGVAINPDNIRAQMEGGIGFGLSAALWGEITLERGVVQPQNFDGYRPLRIDEMPAVEVHIVPSGDAPTGVGEPGVPPIAPAVANAFFHLTGRRVRRLPFARLAAAPRTRVSSAAVRRSVT